MRNEAFSRFGVGFLIGLLATTGTAAQNGSSPGQPTTSEAPDSWSLDRSRLLFTGRRESTADLYLLDRATNRTRRLTHFGGVDSGANSGRVSPDGQRIAFQVRRGKDYDIHIMDLAGGESLNVTRHPDYDVLPTWSPDGRRLGFMSTRGFEPGDIGPFPGHVYVVNTDGTGLKRVTNEPLTSSLGPSDWCADGATLLIARVEGERPDLFLLEVESGRERRLTATSEGESSAVFSHDGRRIAAHAETADESQIVVMDLDGARRRAVTAGPGLRYYPRWSPDDRWIVFTASETGDQYDLQAVEVATGAVVELLATSEDEREGEWLPASGGSAKW